MGKLEQKFDQQEQKIDDLTLNKSLTSNFRRDLIILRFHEQLEQFEASFIKKLDTVIAERIDANMFERMQTEFDKYEGEMDLKFVKLRGEVMQVSEKFTDLQSAMTDEFSNFRSIMTDEFANFRSTVTEEIDTKLGVE